jgi:hypothetical protein
VIAAAIRPDDWNLPLFFHVLGAMVAVGGLILALVYLTAAWRNLSADSLHAGFRALLVWALPGAIVMRVFAQILYSKEGLEDLPTDPAWVGIGFGAGDFGLLFLLIATITAWRGSRAARASGPDGRAGAASVRTATVFTSLLLVAYLIAVWAMTAKPV